VLRLLSNTVDLETLIIHICLIYRSKGANMAQEENVKLVYECVRCGAKVLTEELEHRGGGIKCTVCGFRVLKKIRPPVVKRVKAI
jgi:DNA-directed RNA polymerase subunit P